MLNEFRRIKKMIDDEKNIENLKKIESVNAYDFLLEVLGEGEDIDTIWESCSENGVIRHLYKEQFISILKILNTKQFIFMVIDYMEGEEK